MLECGNLLLPARHCVRLYREISQPITKFYSWASASNADAPKLSVPVAIARRIRKRVIGCAVVHALHNCVSNFVPVVKSFASGTLGNLLHRRVCRIQVAVLLAHG